jgi:MFS transporter, DHA1 family, multidrug resistance protein
MLRVIKQNIAGLKYPVYASLALSFASLGDAFMYPFLPQNAAVMNIPVLWIGFLLSINRFVRIVFNPFVVHLFSKFGVRQTTIVATFIAIVSTFGYGLGWGLGSLIVFRILWGLAYGVLRINTIIYAFEQDNIGLSSGTSRSIQELGPLFSLWIGPVLLNYFPGDMIFICLAIFSLPAIFYALRLPQLEYSLLTKQSYFFQLPSLFNTITFIISFTAEGILIVALGVVLVKNNSELTGWMITSLVAGYLVYRRVCFILFSPLSGAIADRIGFHKVFNASAILVVLGFILVLLGLEPLGIIIIFTFNSVNSTMAPAGSSLNEEDKVRAVASNANWRDIGAATGALIGGFFLSGSYLFETIIITTFILAVLIVFNYRKQKIKQWN